MGLFRKNEETQQEEKRPVDPGKMVLFRLLAVGYLLYTLYQMVTSYIAGGEDAPSVGLLIAAIVIFAGGSLWIGLITYKQYKQIRAEREAQLEEEDRLAELEAQNQSDLDETEE